jgi:hypothetical protein
MVVVTATVQADGFINLDFEETPLPPTTPWSYQPIEMGLPGWRAFLGSDEATEVVFNGLTFGAAYVGVSAGIPDFQGIFSVFLAPGGNSLGVTISQTGFIPGDAQVLRFLGDISSPAPLGPLNDYFGVFVDGQRLAVTDAFSEPGVYNYSADISSFAGQNADLSFTSFYISKTANGLYMDSISFAVPEPSPVALFALAGVLGWFCSQRKPR